MGGNSGSWHSYFSHIRKYTKHSSTIAKDILFVTVLVIINTQGIADWYVRDAVLLMLRETRLLRKLWCVLRNLFNNLPVRSGRKKTIVRENFQLLLINEFFSFFFFFQSGLAKLKSCILIKEDDVTAKIWDTPKCFSLDILKCTANWNKSMIALEGQVSN